MAGFDDAALRVIHQDDEPLTTKTIDAGDPGGIHLKVKFLDLATKHSYLIPNLNRKYLDSTPNFILSFHRSFEAGCFLFSAERDSPVETNTLPSAHIQKL